MTEPKRIQRKRTKGWRMPPNAVYVGRPTKWGNPFTIAQAIEAGYVHNDSAQARAFLVKCFKEWLIDSQPIWWMGEESDWRRAAILESIEGLRGKNLVCWCPLDRSCHSDILLELANQ